MEYKYADDDDDILMVVYYLSEINAGILIYKFVFHCFVYIKKYYVYLVKVIT